MTFCLYHGATEISIQYKISLQRLLGLNPTVSEIIVVHSLSCVQLFETLWTAARQASLSFTICWNSLKLMSIELVMPSNHLILCHSLLLLPPIFPSIRVFSNELALCNSLQSIGASASASVLPLNIQCWLPLGLTGWQMSSAHFRLASKNSKIIMC